jgi:hypothetical protein
MRAKSWLIVGKIILLKNLYLWKRGGGRGGGGELLFRPRHRHLLSPPSESFLFRLGFVDRLLGFKTSTATSAVVFFCGCLTTA